MHTFLSPILRKNPSHSPENKTKTKKNEKTKKKTGGEDNPGSSPPKKVLRREEEPDQGWISPQERKGANPLKDPAAIIGIVAIFLPFVILGIAIATGLVEIPER